MRLFVALDLDRSLRERLEAFLRAGRERFPQARWTRTEALHVTLKFLGEVPSDREPHVRQALRGVRATPLILSVSGLGGFPNPREPRTLWAGVPLTPPLRELAEAVEAALAPLGFVREQRPFAPHLTLARSTHARLLAPLLREPAAEWGELRAEEFFLYLSRPQQGVYQYEKRERFLLRP